LFMGHRSVRQHNSKAGKFQRRTIGGSNNDASLEVRSSITRHVLCLLAVIINLHYVPIAFSKRVLFKNEWRHLPYSLFSVLQSPLTFEDTFLHAAT